MRLRKDAKQTITGFADRHTFLERLPEEAVPQLPRLQFAIIDASYLFDFTVTEFVLADKRLNIGGSSRCMINGCLAPDGAAVHSHKPDLSDFPRLFRRYSDFDLMQRSIGCVSCGIQAVAEPQPPVILGPGFV